jgi:poly(A) polymerase
MVARRILKPVLPEIGEDGAARLAELVAREDDANVEPHPIRRLAALLPPDPQFAAAVAARLRLSNKALKRLVSAAETGPAEEPRALAYRIGTDEAIDRLLLAGAPADAVRSLAGWEAPRLPLSGEDLIAMGLAPGPIVAATLQAVERAWIANGFPQNENDIRALARGEVERALGQG